MSVEQLKRQAIRAMKAEALSNSYRQLWVNEKEIRLRVSALCIVLLAVIVFLLICMWYVS